MTRQQPAKPNFSGKWRLQPESGAAAPPPRLLADADLTITQTADLVTTEESAGGRIVRVTYKLDGSETRQTINRAEVVTKAAWDGDALVTTVSGPSANWKDSWRLAGSRLVIETSVPGRTLTSTRTYERL